MSFYDLLLTNELRYILKFNSVEPGITGVLRSETRPPSYVSGRMHAGRTVSMAMYAVVNLYGAYSKWLDRLEWPI